MLTWQCELVADPIKNLTNMAKLTDMQKWSDKLCKDPVRLKAFLREVMGPTRRELGKEEREFVLPQLQAIKPEGSSNNQHTMTDVYHLGGKVYHVHFGLYDYPMIEEILPEEN